MHLLLTSGFNLTKEASFVSLENIPGGLSMKIPELWPSYTYTMHPLSGYISGMLLQIQSTRSVLAVTKMCIDLFVIREHIFSGGTLCTLTLSVWVHWARYRLELNLKEPTNVNL
uniref:Uncharacterized protein n=1 Tax=Anas platyrhynchos platyrhynchos TaxID=8840 RepID=A0A493TM60_ANAPP